MASITQAPNVEYALSLRAQNNEETGPLRSAGLFESSRIAM